MADVFTRKKRSEIMAAVKGRDTKSTELAMRRLLRNHRITGWRRNLERLPGRPDFAFPDKRIAVFVDGCFWHGCASCAKCARPPSSNTAYWSAKIESNRRRDRRVTRSLHDMGWRVIRIWEHTLRKQPARCLSRIQKGMS